MDKLEGLRVAKAKAKKQKYDTPWSKLADWIWPNEVQDGEDEDKHAKLLREIKDDEVLNRDLDYGQVEERDRTVETVARQINLAEPKLR